MTLVRSTPRPTTFETSSALSVTDMQGRVSEECVAAIGWRGQSGQGHKNPLKLPRYTLHHTPTGYTFRACM